MIVSEENSIRAEMKERMKDLIRRSYGPDCNLTRTWWEKFIGEDFHHWMVIRDTLNTETIVEDQRTGKYATIYTCTRCGAKEQGKWLKPAGRMGD